MRFFKRIVFFIIMSSAFLAELICMEAPLPSSVARATTTSYESLRPNPCFASFTFPEKSFIKLNRNPIDDGLSELRAVLVGTVSSAIEHCSNQKAVAEAMRIFTTACVDQMQHAALLAQVEDIAASPVANTSDRSRCEDFLCTGLFHIKEFMSFLEAREREIQVIRKDIDGMEQELICIDQGKPLKTLQKKLDERDKEVTALRNSQEEILFLLLSLYPCSSSQLENLVPRVGFGIHNTCISFPIDLEYHQFLQRIFSTNCATLNAAFQTGNIEFKESPTPTR